MKFVLDVPSAAAGAGAAGIAFLALSSPLLSGIGLLDYSGWSPLWAAGGIAVLAGAASFIERDPVTHVRKGRGGDRRARMSDAFPSAVRGDGQGNPSLTPWEWVSGLEARYGVSAVGERDLEALVRRGLEEQVRHRVDPDLKAALEIAFHGFSIGDGNGRRFVDELARRMRRCSRDGGKFDLGSYVSACRAIGYSGPEVRTEGFSPFDTVSLVHDYTLAREHGILASAEFLWLKEQDRVLWYALNNVGRKAFHVEGVGVMAHYASQMADPCRPLRDPDVGAAVSGVMEYFGLVERPEA
jgi:hypothetical protein